MSYERLSLVTAVITGLLCSVLLLYPSIIFLLFEIPENASATFIGRRAAMLFFGISLICWLARKAPVSEARQAISLGLSLAMFALAGLGLMELFKGFTGIGILVAVITEVVLGVAHLMLWQRYRRSN